MIEEADSRGFLKAAKCEQILPSLFFRWWVMKQNTEKEIFLESYQQKQSNAVAMHSEGQCLHSSCTTWDVLKLNELPRVQQILQSPHLGNMQHNTRKRNCCKYQCGISLSIYMLHVRGIIWDRTGLRPTVDTFWEREDRFPKVTDR